MEIAALKDYGANKLGSGWMFNVRRQEPTYAELQERVKALESALKDVLYTLGYPPLTSDRAIPPWADKNICRAYELLEKTS